jgi:hypothetical protein
MIQWVIVVAAEIPVMVHQVADGVQLHKISNPSTKAGEIILAQKITTPGI